MNKYILKGLIGYAFILFAVLMYLLVGAIYISGPIIYNVVIETWQWIRQ